MMEPGESSAAAREMFESMMRRLPAESWTDELWAHADCVNEQPEVRAG